MRWAWIFLDLPEEGLDEGIAFWRRVTATRLSPWRGERDEFTTLLPPSGAPWVKVQRVEGPGGVHLDLDVEGPLADARADAVALGARVVADLDDVVVCQSPGGLSFCLGVGSREADPAHQERDVGPSLLDQVCLDIPSDRYAGELTFWSRLTGWDPEPGSTHDLTPLTRPDGIPVRLLAQRVEEADGVVTAHVDLACADRAAEVQRHERLGARLESHHEHWSVLRAPDGRRYCLTDREPRTGLLA